MSDGASKVHHAVVRALSRFRGGDADVSHKLEHPQKATSGSSEETTHASKVTMDELTYYGMFQNNVEAFWRFLGVRSTVGQAHVPASAVHDPAEVVQATEKACKDRLEKLRELVRGGMVFVCVCGLHKHMWPHT